MHCRWWNPQILFFFFYILHWWYYELFHLSKIWPLWGAYFRASHVADLLPISLISSEAFKQELTQYFFPPYVMLALHDRNIFLKCWLCCLNFCIKPKLSFPSMFTSLSVCISLFLFAFKGNSEHYLPFE